ncbi:uncharacterized protein EKO05_0005296 [Ascochyta rabiei]|uniref:Transferase n=1 Tax=Didymella rabiei TaxID=5454 RepID=A0A163G7I0_DIDRA|nr:uncharacterized protein EKO05_0005296 [Ascochyta rabiei]KZM24724.1 transferase [Ascochyta rabiei]UPX14825.1 hypothetical protein EKO05_0005296 [Ascochyta rabiei]
MQTATLRAAPLRRTHTHPAPQRRRIQTAQCFADGPRPLQAEVERARAYCANLIRTYDTPSHILQSFVPQSSRDAYLAIRAFNVDVARVADTTSTPTVGMMRMQFWRDTVTKALAGSPPKEPVAILLAHAAEHLQSRTDGKSRLSKNWFHRVINTREQYLANPPYPTLSSLESYAENTYSTLLYLTLSALPQASLTTDHIASHIGKAAGIAALLRGVPLIAFPQPQPARTAAHITGQSGPAQGAVLLPLDVMAEANVREEDVFRLGAHAPGLRDAVFAVATRANDHLITAREMLAKLRSEGSLGHAFEHQDDGEHQYTSQQRNAGSEQQLSDVEAAFGVFMPSVSTQSWLDRLQNADFDLFSPTLRKTDWKLPAKAYWAYTRRKI